jgi:hypothetical protein
MRFGGADFNDAAHVDGVTPDVDTATQNVDVCDVQTGQLAPPQSAVGQRQHDHGALRACLLAAGADCEAVVACLEGVVDPGELALQQACAGYCDTLIGCQGEIPP